MGGTSNVPGNGSVKMYGNIGRNQKTYGNSKKHPNRSLGSVEVFFISIFH